MIQNTVSVRQWYRQSIVVFWRTKFKHLALQYQEMQIQIVYRIQIIELKQISCCLEQLSDQPKQASVRAVYKHYNGLSLDNHFIPLTPLFSLMVHCGLG